MATTLQRQHACNRGTGSDADPTPSIFRNDANNVAALQSARIQKKLAEEAAHLQKEQLDAAAKSLASEVEDREKVQKERDALRSDNKTLNQTLQIRDGEFAGARREIETLKGEKRELENLKNQKENELTSAINGKQQADNLRLQKEQELNTANNYKTSLQNQINTLSAKVSGMENCLPNTSRQDNCLPFQYHNSTVMIVNLGSQRSIDAGGENGTMAYGWDYDLAAGNQTFTLTKVNGRLHPDEYWIIARRDNGQRFYFSAGDTGIELRLGCTFGNQDYWYIGRGPGSRVGSWVIKNARWGTQMALENGFRNNGTRILSDGISDRLEANWVIIPIAFSS
ncbi:Fc.00g080400.m01.CDS01 [Cosmosporella sp. VM-42]